MNLAWEPNFSHSWAKALVVLLIVGCAPHITPPPTLQPNAITRDQAIAGAIQEAPPGLVNLTVESAFPGQDPFHPVGIVWLVRLDADGGIPSCAPGYLERAKSPSDAPCLDDHFNEVHLGVTAAIDPQTGQLLGWTH